MTANRLEKAIHAATGDVSECGRCLSVEKGKRGFEKLPKTLEAVVDEDGWDQLEGFTSQRFDPGRFKTVTEKGIDVYGREVVGVRKVK